MWVRNLNLLHYVINVIWIDYFLKKLIDMFAILLGLMISRKEIKPKPKPNQQQNSLVGQREMQEKIEMCIFDKKI